MILRVGVAGGVEPDRFWNRFVLAMCHVWRGFVLHILRRMATPGDRLVLAPVGTSTWQTEVRDRLRICSGPLAGQVTHWPPSNLKRQHPLYHLDRRTQNQCSLYFTQTSRRRLHPEKERPLSAAHATAHPPKPRPFRHWLGALALSAVTRCASGAVPRRAVLKHFPPVDAAVAAFFGQQLLGAGSGRARGDTFCSGQKQDHAWGRERERERERWCQLDMS